MTWYLALLALAGCAMTAPAMSLADPKVEVRDLGVCEPVGERTDAEGTRWILLHCESGAYVVLPIPPKHIEL